MSQSPKALSRMLLPCLTVLLASVTGAYLVYDNYLVDRGAASQMASFEPAAGGPLSGGSVSGQAAAISP